MAADLHDVDAGPLIGSWRNTNPDTGQIVALRIRDGDGAPMLEAWGASGPACRAWGLVPIGHLYRGNPGTPAAAAFEAVYEIGPMTAVLEANLSKGLLIIACMKTFRDGSGRSDYFVREFFRKAEAPPAAESIPVDRSPRPVTCDDDEAGPVAGPAGPRRLDPDLFLGRWANTDPATRGIREVRAGAGEDGLRLGFAFVEGAATGGTVAVVARPFADRASGTSATQFRAEFDRPGERLRMHGWVKLGVMVIAVFRRPDETTNFAPGFDREFFYRADRS